MPENNTQIFLETRLPVNQLLFALSKRLVLPVPNLITATNFSDKLNYNFYHLKKKNNKYKRHYKTRYY